MQALQKEFSWQKRIFAAGISRVCKKRIPADWEKIMKIIISPAKRMEECGDLFEPGAPAVFLERTKLLLAVLKGKSEGELKELFGANEQITHENFLRYAGMDLDRAQTPALLSYVGIQYQYMAPKLFSYEEWEYAKKHVRILSGFYGLLKPDTPVVPYRLEMQAKLAAGGAKNLYEFWGGALAGELEREEKELEQEEEREEEREETGVILNLASAEYSRAAEPYLSPKTRFVSCVFGSLKDGKVKVKATEAKMARGEMVRYLAQNQVKTIKDVREFRALGFSFDAGRSKEDCLVFVKG